MKFLKKYSLAFEKMSYNNKVENRKGYIVISTVLLLLFVTLGIAATMSFLSAGESKISQSFSSGQQALFFSDACLEEGLLRFKRDVTYVGGIVNFPEGACHLEISNDDTDYIFKASFIGVKNYVRSVESKVRNVDGILQIVSWSEKPFVIN